MTFQWIIDKIRYYLNIIWIKYYYNNIMILPHKTHNDIIMILLHQWWLTAKQLYEQLFDETITLTQLYNILKLLYNQQIISKHEKKYHINAMRIHQLEDAIKHYHPKHQSINRSELRIGSHVTLKAWSLSELDPIRWDVFYGLCKKSQTQEIHSYYTHTYYPIGMYETEKTFFESARYQFHTAIQHNTPLDQYGIKLYQQMWIQDIKSCSKSLLFGTEWRVINIIGPYVIDFLMPQILEHYFVYHFSTVQHIYDFNHLQFTSLFQMPIQCNLKIIHDPALAEQYRRLIIWQLRQ